VLSGRGLCDGLITRPEEFYRLWRVVVCDQETSKNEEVKAHYRTVENTTTMGCKARKRNKYSADITVATRFDCFIYCHSLYLTAIIMKKDFTGYVY
jgi:hypothetical protein